jgi:uncharacterized membrane protein YphA (DoxX/SURF4 family)
MNRGVQWLVLIMRLILGGIFLAAGILKVTNVTAFAAQIAGFQILPTPVVAPLAGILPLVEIVVGVLLLVGFATRITAWFAAGQVAIFTIAIASAVVRGLSISCGCFGANDRTTTSWAEVARDSLFVILAIVIAMRAPGMISVDRRIEETQ